MRTLFSARSTLTAIFIYQKGWMWYSYQCWCCDRQWWAVVSVRSYLHMCCSYDKCCWNLSKSIVDTSVGLLLCFNDAATLCFICHYYFVVVLHHRWGMCFGVLLSKITWVVTCSVGDSEGWGVIMMIINPVCDVTVWELFCAPLWHHQLVQQIDI